jgi:lipopolysaccharide/colanic/teichoic acid biosynthesis glycosyltransferase
MENIFPSPGVTTRRRKSRLPSFLTFLDRILKRAMDIVVSFVGLILLSPVFAVFAILIVRDSKGPVFFRGSRLGKGGKVFKILKFRTMFENEKSYEGARITAQNDDRITSLGQWLRRTKINELPQLWNVLIGEMSLVGPRPEDPEFAKQWDPEARHLLLSVAPGITSPASILYRDEESLLKGDAWMADYLGEILPSKMRLDLLYIRNRTIFTDLDVIFWTALTLIPAARSKEVPNHLLYWGPVARFFSWFLNWFVIDMLVSLAATLFAILVWEQYAPFQVTMLNAALFSLELALLFSMTNYIFGLTQVVWSKAEAIKAFDLVFAAGLGTLTYIVLDRVVFPPASFAARVVLVSGAFAAVGFVMVRYRERLITGLATRWLSARSRHSSVGERVMIIGAGEMGEFATWLFTRSKFVGVLSICGIVDDDPRKVGMVYSGYHVLGTTQDLQTLVAEYDVGVLIYAISKIDPQERSRIMDLMKQTPAKLVMLPDMMEIIRSSFHAAPDSEPLTQAEDQRHESHLELEKWFEEIKVCLDKNDITAAQAALQEFKARYHGTTINDD